MFNRFTNKKILVLGDLMLDEYIEGSVNRISPEAPVPVIEIKNRFYSLGGADNVTANLKDLGAEPIMVGVIGDDINGKKIKSIFEEKGLDTTGLITDFSRPTTSKTRIIASSQQIVRIDDESTSEINLELQNKILTFIKEIINQCHSVVFSDYEKGLLTKEICQEIIALAKKMNIKTIVDPKLTYKKYFNIDLFKPNEKELFNMTHEKDLHRAARIIFNELNLKNLVLTQGEKGMLLFDNFSVTEIPTSKRQIYNVTGAGDTVTAVLAFCLANSIPLIEACKLANTAAGIVIGKKGTSTVIQEELMKEFSKKF